MKKETKVKQPKQKLVCSNCGKEDDFYNTVAGPRCWDCDYPPKENTVEVENVENDVAAKV